MSQANVEVVERAIAAVNQRDVDTYLACCAEDIQLHTPLSAIEGVYEGRDAIRRFFENMAATSDDFRIAVERIESISADRVLAFLRLTGSGRSSGIPMAVNTPSTNIYELVDGKINRIRVFLDREDALKAVGLSM
jgi:steroid delta-isomerase-like uncharacterized protein